MYLIADNIRKIRKPLGRVLPVLPQLFLFFLRYIVRICSVTVIIITAMMIAVIIGRIRNTLRRREQLMTFFTLIMPQNGFSMLTLMDMGSNITTS